MSRKLIAALLLGAAFFSGRPLGLAQTQEEGFQSLFNGTDLAGWDGNPKLWSVKEGAITGQTTADNPAKGNTFLIWTNGTVGDFELRCKFRITSQNDKGFANSGIQYRSQVLDPKGWVVGGYQADMEAGPNYTGILYEEKMTRGIMATRGERVVWDSNCVKRLVGKTGTPEELAAAIKNNICGKVHRDLVSIEVFPMKNYGALETGVHRFSHPGIDTDQGDARFVQLWKYEGGRWWLTVVISYSHNEPVSGNVENPTR